MISLRVIRFKSVYTFLEMFGGEIPIRNEKHIDFRSLYYNKFYCKKKSSVSVLMGNFPVSICWKPLQNEEQLWKVEKQETQSMMSKKHTFVESSLSFQMGTYSIWNFMESGIYPEKNDGSKKRHSFLR